MVSVEHIHFFVGICGLNDERLGGGRWRRTVVKLSTSSQIDTRFVTLQVEAFQSPLGFRQLTRK